MRLTGSPAERLEVEPVVRETGGGQGGADQGGPALGAADEHVALGDVGHPAQERGHVVDPLVDPTWQPGAVAAAVPGEVEDRKPALASEDVELVEEERLGGPPVKQHAVTRPGREPFGERPQRGDADAGADQGDAPAGAGPGAEPAVRSLEQSPGARPQRERRGA